MLNQRITLEGAEISAEKKSYRRRPGKPWKYQKSSPRAPVPFPGFGRMLQTQPTPNTYRKSYDGKLLTARRWREAKVAQWWEHSPPTNVVRPGFERMPYASWVCCWFSPRGSLRVLRFFPLLKNQHFQIPIRSGHTWTRFGQSAPWVNKLQNVFNYKKIIERKKRKKYLNKYIFFALFLCLLFDRLGVLLFSASYRKIPKISPGAYISQRPFLWGIFLEGLIYEGKFAFQNRLG